MGAVNFKGSSDFGSVGAARISRSFTNKHLLSLRAIEQIAYAEGSGPRVHRACVVTEDAIFLVAPSSDLKRPPPILLEDVTLVARTGITDRIFLNAQWDGLPTHVLLLARTRTTGALAAHHIFSYGEQSALAGRIESAWSSLHARIALRVPVAVYVGRPPVAAEHTRDRAPMLRSALVDVVEETDEVGAADVLSELATALLHDRGLKGAAAESSRFLHLLSGLLLRQHHRAPERRRRRAGSPQSPSPPASPVTPARTTPLRQRGGARTPASAHSLTPSASGASLPPPVAHGPLVRLAALDALYCALAQAEAVPAAVRWVVQEPRRNAAFDMCTADLGLPATPLTELLDSAAGSDSDSDSDSGSGDDSSSGRGSQSSAGSRRGSRGRGRGRRAQARFRDAASMISRVRSVTAPLLPGARSETADQWTAVTARQAAVVLQAACLHALASLQASAAAAGPGVLRASLASGSTAASLWLDAVAGGAGAGGGAGAAVRGTSAGAGDAGARTAQITLARRAVEAGARVATSAVGTPLLARAAQLPSAPARAVRLARAASDAISAAAAAAPGATAASATAAAAASASVGSAKQRTAARGSRTAPSRHAGGLVWAATAVEVLAAEGLHASPVREALQRRGRALLDRSVLHAPTLARAAAREGVVGARLILAVRRLATALGRPPPLLPRWASDALAEAGVAGESALRVPGAHSATFHGKALRALAVHRSLAPPADAVAAGAGAPMSGRRSSSAASASSLDSHSPQGTSSLDGIARSPDDTRGFDL